MHAEHGHEQSSLAVAVLHLQNMNDAYQDIKSGNSQP
jgi:hypothetical protein